MRISTLAATASLVVALAVASPSSRAQERYDDQPPANRFALKIGGFLVQEFDTTIRFDSTQVPIGTVIDLEESLNVDAEARVARIDGFYRFNKKHSINYGWFAVNRGGDTVVTEEIRIGDPETGEEIIIEAGASVVSNWDFDIINVSYSWSFLNTWRYELFFGGGLNIRDLKIDIVGDFDPGSGDLTEEHVDAKGVIPLPVVTFGGRWNFSPNWRMGWHWQFFALKLGDYEGSVQDTVLVFENDTFKHVGFGLGLNSFELNVEANADQLKGQLDESYVGILGYLKVYF